MKRILLSIYFLIFAFCGSISIVLSESTSKGPDDQRHIGCQQKSTSGRTYNGKANTTHAGIPCQQWSDREPHDHRFTHVGDHNFCRNPTLGFRVWCFTTDPDVQVQYCSVPFCPHLKALDFSLDNDNYLDDIDISYTHANLQKEDLPSSFTICAAFMVKTWAEYVGAKLFVLLDANSS